MGESRRLGRGSRLFAVVAVAAAVFGVASAVQADIPDSGVIHGCYGKPGTPQKGQLRVRDASLGEQCRFNENPVDWNATGVSGVTGPTGPTGPSGVAGPTSVTAGASGSVTTAGVTVVTHTVTAAEAGLTILTSPFMVSDNNGTTGGATTVDCSILVNGGGGGFLVTVSDNGSAADGDTTSMTNIDRRTLAAGDVVTVECSTVFNPGDSGEASVNASLLLERVTG
jgi:hypothetical protein